ncbi:MAG: tyrosine-type recombinase/integrase [Acidimicrobiales bacterium]
MTQPPQEVQVWSIQNRPGKPRPWAVRWGIEGKQFSRAFRTKVEADRRRSQLLVAQQRGERFDPQTGEPISWAPRPTTVTVYTWARQWLAEEWDDWAPRTRASQVEGLARFVPLAVRSEAPEPPANLRAYLSEALAPKADIDARSEHERWLARWCLPLSELNEERLAEVERRLGLGDTGQALAPNTAGRYRRIAHTCTRRAVELKQIPADPWPPTPKGRARRKSRRRRAAVDVRRLPSPAAMAAIIDAIPSHQPGSRKYQVMTGISYYAGLRPSEVVMLRPRALELPDHEGWGVIHVVEADDGYDEPAEPKTGARSVPAPPVLVQLLGSWVAELRPEPSDLLFRTRNGKRPTQSNWSRALKRATEAAGYPALSPYDCRHACATTWLAAGVPLGEVAKRLGHSVETLVAHYVGALAGDDLVANQRIEAALEDLGGHN